VLVKVTDAPDGHASAHAPCSLGLARLPRCGTSASGSRYTKAVNKFGEMCRSALVLAALLSACGGSDSDRSARMSNEDSWATILDKAPAIGAEDSDEESFARIMAARLTADEQSVVVLDDAPPYVRVFSTTGLLRNAFFQRGGGPNELNGARALAVWPDRLRLISGPYLVESNLAGRAVEKHLMPFPAVAIETHCDTGMISVSAPDKYDEYALYQGINQPRVVGHVASSLSRGWEIGFVGLIQAADEGTILAASLSELAAHGIISCNGEIAERSYSWAMALLPSMRPRERPTQRQETSSGYRTSHDASHPRMGGAAEIDGMLLWLEHLVPPGRRQLRPVTQAYLISKDGWFTATAEGRYTLQDVGRELALLSTSEPWPRILMVPLTEIVRTLKASSWEPRR
jgi:hypothetical protein